MKMEKIQLQFILNKNAKLISVVAPIIESMMNNRINIEFLQKQVEKMMNDIEKLKDADRKLANGNGH